MVRNIQKLKDDIQQLEIDKIKLINQNTKKDQVKDQEVVEVEKLKAEIEKCKREISFLEEALNVEKDKSEKLIQSHKKEIEEYQKKIEDEKNNTKAVKEEKLKEINLLKADISKVNKDLNMYSKKAEIAEKRLDDEKQKNFMIQTKLDKKGKELQEMNEYTKKLLANIDNLIAQYEEKIEEITKDKNDLIAQNKQLLGNPSEGNPEGENNQKNAEQYMHENKLLTEEIKGLKEQIESQAKDLIDLNSFEKEIVRLREQNEVLTKDNKSYKAKLEELKKNGVKNIGEFNAFKLNRSVGKTFMEKNKAFSTFGKKLSYEINMNEVNYQKKLNALKKIIEENKKDFEDKLNKVYYELAETKAKNTSLSYEVDELKMKYRNMLKAITNQCNKKGIKLNLGKI